MSEKHNEASEHDHEFLVSASHAHREAAHHFELAAKHHLLAADADSDCCCCCCCPLFDYRPDIVVVVGSVYTRCTYVRTHTCVHVRVHVVHYSTYTVHTHTYYYYNT